MLTTYQLSFKDTDNNVSQHQVNFDTSVTGESISSVVAFLSTYKDAVQGLSDAIIVDHKIRLPRVTYPDIPAGPDSDVYRRLTLFSLTNDGEATSISIPSPRADLFDITGDFIGFRLLEQIASINTALAPLINGGLMIDEAGRPILGPFVVGCRSVQE